MKEKNKKRKYSLAVLAKRAFFMSLFIGFLGVSGWTFIFSDYTKIKSVEIITDQLSKEPIENIFDELKWEVWLNYVPQDNFFTFPRNKFTRTVKDQFKIVRGVRFENYFPDEIKIIIEERQGLIIWCNEGKCFLMDEAGEIFYELQEKEKDDRFKDLSFIIDQSNQEVEMDKKIDQAGLVETVELIKKRLEEDLELGIYRKIKTPSVISDEIRIKTKDDWEIYFNLSDSIENQINLLEEILKSSISSEEKKKLNYIDLRVSGKAIYKTSLKENKEKTENSEEDSKEESDQDD